MTKKLTAKSILIIGWNERTKNIIEFFNIIIPKLKIILIDNSITEIPHSFEQVKFIIGNPTYDETLEKADIIEHEIVVITADRHTSESFSDTKSIITLLAIKSINPSIYTIIEILTPSQQNNALRAGADKIINTSEVFANNCYNFFQN